MSAGVKGLIPASIDRFWPAGPHGNIPDMGRVQEGQKAMSMKLLTFLFQTLPFPISYQKHTKTMVWPETSLVMVGGLRKYLQMTLVYHKVLTLKGLTFQGNRFNKVLRRA